MSSPSYSCNSCMIVIYVYVKTCDAGRLCPKEGQVKVAAAIVQLHDLSSSDEPPSFPPVNS